jgi:hypothetical protein
METVFVDYSALNDSAEGVPPERESGKFVQLRNGDKEYLVFSPTAVTPYHADIIERFCADRDIEGVYDARTKRFNIRDREWTVAGGGKYERDSLGKRIRLYDNSMAYGRFDSRGLLARIHKVDALKDYTVLIQ